MWHRLLLSCSNWILVLALFGSWMLVSCGGGGNTSPPPPPALQSISITPQNLTNSAGQTQQFQATGSYSDGSTRDLTTTVSWSSATPGVATIARTGLAASLAAGTATIQATSGSISGSTSLHVTVTAWRDVTYFIGSSFPSGGINPRGVVVADFNGDGKLDIAVSNTDTNTVAVFLKEASGSFGTPIITTVQIPGGLGSLALGDFNEDEKPDLVVATISGNQSNIVLLGSGDGTFRQQSPIPNSFGFFHAKVADLNGDGHEDLVLGCNGNLSISMGRGDGTFIDTVQLPQPNIAGFSGIYLGITVADFNGDGKLDIVATDAVSAYSFGILVFYPGNGDGTFGNVIAARLPVSQPGSLASGNVYGDGKQDILVGFPNLAFIMRGNGDGTFDLSLANIGYVYSRPPTTSDNGITVFAGDLIWDGKIDAVTSDSDIGTLQIVLNSALGLAPTTEGYFSFALSPGITEIAAGDLNGDGVLDVVVTNYLTSEITIILSGRK